MGDQYSVKSAQNRVAKLNKVVAWPLLELTLKVFHSCILLGQQRIGFHGTLECCNLLVLALNQLCEHSDFFWHLP